MYVSMLVLVYAAVHMHMVGTCEHICLSVRVYISVGECECVHVAMCKYLCYMCQVMLQNITKYVACCQMENCPLQYS